MMATLNDFSPIETRTFRSRFQEELRGCAHLQEAAQKCARIIYEEFQESIVLARVFATLSFRDLPSRDKEFITNLANLKRIASLLGDKTPVLSLLGTYGARSEWNNRYNSQGHLGIPLVTASFVDSIPMVSRLMSDMGIGLDWFDEWEPHLLVKSFGRTTGVFYVRDAKTRVDQQNRKIVSVQDFVAAEDIRTVFGLGGSYLNGSFLTMIIFTRETVEQPQAERFMSLVNTFKIATMSLVMKGAIFTDGSTVPQR
ncbi:MAG: hypothetical protein M3Y84_04620 [Acidobacteriota bacterium]|nr:hypothetical protein [Acidobacteriota bacterium]